MELGLTRSGVRHRVDKGMFVRGLPGMLRLAGAPRTYEQRRLEALMWAGDGAALSHRAAALAWRLDPIQNKIIELTSPRDLRHAPKGIIVHIARLGGRDVGRLDSLRVTSPARTLVDLSSVVSDRRKSNAVVLAGWSLLRFTDADVKTRSDEVVAAVLAARGHRKLWDIAPL